MSARESPGLRCCTSLSRHSSVVISVPWPFTSMLPPSSTTRSDLSSTVKRRLPLRNFHQPRDPACDPVVVLGIWILCPGVEFPIRGSQRELRSGIPLPVRLATHEDGAVVARPYAIRGPAMKAHARLRCAVRVCRDRDSRIAKYLPRSLFFCFVLNQQLYAFIPREVTDDLGKYPWDWLKFAWPVGAMMRPGQPGCGMRFPLGRHAVTKFGWSVLRSNLSCA